MATSDVRYANCLACHQPRALPRPVRSIVRSVARVRCAVSAPGALGDVSPAAAARIVIGTGRVPFSQSQSHARQFPRNVPAVARLPARHSR